MIKGNRSIITQLSRRYESEFKPVHISRSVNRERFFCIYPQLNKLLPGL